MTTTEDLPDSRHESISGDMKRFDIPADKRDIISTCSLKALHLKINSQRLQIARETKK